MLAVGYLADRPWAGDLLRDCAIIFASVSDDGRDLAALWLGFLARMAHIRHRVFAVGWRTVALDSMWRGPHVPSAHGLGSPAVCSGASDHFRSERLVAVAGIRYKHVSMECIAQGDCEQWQRIFRTFTCERS